MFLGGRFLHTEKIGAKHSVSIRPYSAPSRRVKKSCGIMTGTRIETELFPGKEVSGAPGALSVELFAWEIPALRGRAGHRQ